MTDEYIDLHFFPANCVENIHRAIQAKKWAIPLRSCRRMPGMKTKAKRLNVGTLGVIYLSEGGNRMVTTPFTISSPVDTDSVVTGVWPGEWSYSFSIEPFGGPDRTMSAEALRSLNAYRLSTKKNLASVYRVTALQAFVPATIPIEDLKEIFSRISHR